MSLFLMRVMDCNWPTLPGLLSTTSCLGRRDGYEADAATVRKAAAAAGWFHTGPYDFCGVDSDGIDTNLQGHGVLMRAGNHKLSMTAVSGRKGPYRRVWPRCGCGWKCGPQTVHTYSYESPDGISLRLAPVVWLEVHVRVDLAALPPKHSVEGILAARQALDKRMAELERQPAETLLEQ